jgi:hypothetical protein
MRSESDSRGMMNWKGVIAAIAVFAALPVRGDEVAQNVREAMRTAMLEQAPLPSGPAALPDRMAPALPRTQVAKRSVEADRAAREHAARNAGMARAEAANHAAMKSMMSGSQSAGQYGCDKQLPADMMKSRGTMPGGGMMPGTNGGGGGGMPGGGMPGSMLSEPNTTSTGAPSRGALQR